MKQTHLLKLLCPLGAVVLAVHFVTPEVRAQEASPTNAVPESARSLESLVEEALEKNPELKFYEAEIAAAKAGRKMAGLPGNPELSGSVGRKTARGDGINGAGMAWSVSVMQPFEWPGRIGLRKSIANKDIELAQLGYERFKVALTGRMRTLAYGLFAAQEKAIAAKEVAERFKALRETLVQRDPAGLTPQLETRVIEATELNAQRRATDAELATQAALLELNQLRGVRPGSGLSVSDTHLEFRPVEESSALLRMANTNNFELRLRATELEQQGFRVDLAKNERFPTISLGPAYSDEQAGDRERIIGLGISLPLPLWNRNKGNIEASAARRLQAEVSLDVAQREVQRQVMEAAATYAAKLRDIGRWRPDAVAHFKEAAELADRHYRLGAVPIATYVELQKQYLEAVDGLLDTRKETLNAAAKLEVLTGLTPPLANAVEKEAK